MSNEIEKKAWQKTFLEKGTELGLGDLSMMVSCVGKIREEAYSLGREEVLKDADEVVADDFSIGWDNGKDGLSVAVVHHNREKDQAEIIGTLSSSSPSEGFINLGAALRSLRTKGKV